LRRGEICGGEGHNEGEGGLRLEGVKDDLFNLTGKKGVVKREGKGVGSTSGDARTVAFVYSKKRKGGGFYERRRGGYRNISRGG